MLVRFKVENHLSFNDAEELSLVASALSDRGKRVDLIDAPAPASLRLLPAAVVYGANASGKSNLVRAMGFLRNQVLFPRTPNSQEKNIKRRAFALAGDRRDRLSIFDIVFLVNGVRYDYFVALSDDEVKIENLYYYPKGSRSLMFERSSSSIKFGRAVSSSRIKFFAASVRQDTLFLATCLLNNVSDFDVIGSWFGNFGGFIGISIDPDQINNTIRRSEISSRIEKFLDTIGTGVCESREIRVERTEEEIDFHKKFMDLIKSTAKGEIDGDFPEPDPERFTIELGHRSQGGSVEYFPLSWESAGTRRLIVMLREVFGALDSGSPLVIDEFDTSIHTAISEAIISLFASKKTNPKGSQLIVTTHDTNLLASKYLRRDQIWFVEKDLSGSSHLSALSDFAVRADAAFEQGYLQGRFGAVPFAGDPSTLFS